MLRIRNLSRPALEPTDLDVAAGECVALSGPSGSGKTLLLRAIADLDPATGEAYLDGRPREAFTGPEWRRRVAWVPAEAAWWTDRVRDHFEDGAAIESAVESLGLGTAILDKPVSRLSTGERQRLALVRALANRPDVILLDEFTSGLDPESKAMAETLIRERLDAGAAVLLATHDADQSERLGGRKFRMEAGRLTPAGDAP